MTGKEIEKAKKDLHVWENGKCRKLTKEEEKLDEELSCRDMIDSIICYGIQGRSAYQILFDEENGYHNYLARYTNILGRDRVLELIAEQLNDIVYIKENVYTDCEGLSYNSVVYRDEI